MHHSDPRLLFLNSLERRESQLLSWGLVDGSFSDEEIKDLAEDFLADNGLWGQYPDPKSLIRAMRDVRLLYGFDDGVGMRFRTRMAEAIRLLARLRQLFPGHFSRGNRQWQTASPLVGDYRFLLRARQIPQRNLDLATVRGRIKNVIATSDLQDAVLEAIFQRGDSWMELASFQLRATENILQESRSNRSSGTIVCAGTGSGKTLSFYLPAFLNICESISSSAWTRCIALYPRNELLKDQLSEAYVQARKLDRILEQSGKRKLTIATLFGATPENENAFNYENPPQGWTVVGSGHVCPYFPCPENDCDGRLIWRTDDRMAKRHKLCCERCSFATGDDEVILTRAKLKSFPADILFTTTEMLNQRMGDSRFGHVFGIGVPRGQKPPLVLMDEVHTYAGISGAQTALLLRRWKHLASVSPHFVGLSATLANARKFFATLVGVDDHRVEEISPLPHEMDRVSMEYMLALRGDPAAQSALLSTTIQTAMLMRRVLDSTEPGARTSEVYGHREFIFTDDLDVTNRLFFNLRDAEGQDSWGRPDVNRHQNGSLANFRRSAGIGDDQTRDRFGQRWGLCEWIGHTLDDGTAAMRIDRTSSQDAGVATEAEVIVATAALEVGFNDPDVNVVIQHKAPRDSAQFLQRKGRAGRRIEMRPWTLIALSDYGRDRLAWQSFDILFDPELSPRELPVRNRYVQRIQAVFACFDWISTQLRRQRELPDGSVYRDFSAPSHQLGSRYQSHARPRQLAAAKIIEDLLVRNEGYDELFTYLCEALDESESTVESLMWEPPRAVMTAALPTLHRRLVSNWQNANDNSIDYIVNNNPLPEFVPGQLFGDLNLPEVTIISPPQQRGDDERQEPLPILQAMKGFAPGKVSRRFGIMNTHARHWIEPTSLTTSGTQDLHLNQLLSDYDELGAYDIINDDEEVQAIRCVRPRAMRVVVPERRVLDSSNAFLRWHTQICPDTEGTAVDLPSPSRWETIVREIRFFTHNQNQPLEVRRVATESNATISFQNGQQLETALRFTENVEEGAEEQNSPEPIGVGFTIDVDGLVIRYQIPSGLIGKLSTNQEMLRCLRVSRFKDLVGTDQSLDGVASSFQRQWLAQIFLSALTNTAIHNDSELVDAWQLAQQDFSTINAHAVLSVIFQSIPISESGNPDDPSDDLDDVQQRLQQELSLLLNEPLVQASLRRHAETLWENPNETWTEWTSRKFRTTMGAAILEAIQQVCSDLDAGDLILDVESGPRSTGSVSKPDGLEEIWLTERTVGGGGVVECLLSRYGEDPRRFFELVENALRPSDYEIADEQLTIFLDWLEQDTDVRNRVANLRIASTETHNAYADAFEALKHTLAQKGLFVCHSVIAAISNRILRPGSTHQTDALLQRLITDWKALESRLNVEIDPRVFAYQQSDRDDIDQAILQFGADELETDRRQWRFNAIFSLLWPRGGVTRSSGLSVYNPFSSLPTTEHDLVRLFLTGEPKKVSIEEPNWRTEFARYLVDESLVILEAPSSRLGDLRESLLSVMTHPTDTGAMLVHPNIRSIERRNGKVRLTMSLSEAIQ